MTRRYIAKLDLLPPASRQPRQLRLANLDNGVFERLGRYEAALRRQIVQTLFALQSVRHRTADRLRVGHCRHQSARLVVSGSALACPGSIPGRPSSRLHRFIVFLRQIGFVL
jgi:hypothetical protein